MNPPPHTHTHTHTHTLSLPGCVSGQVSALQPADDREGRGENTKLLPICQSLKLEVGAENCEGETVQGHKMAAEVDGALTLQEVGDSMAPNLQWGNTEQEISLTVVFFIVSAERSSLSSAPRGVELV